MNGRYVPPDTVEGLVKRQNEATDRLAASPGHEVRASLLKVIAEPYIRWLYGQVNAGISGGVVHEDLTDILAWMTMVHLGAYVGFDPKGVAAMAGSFAADYSASLALMVTDMAGGEGDTGIVYPFEVKQ